MNENAEHGRRHGVALPVGRGDRLDVDWPIAGDGVAIPDEVMFGALPRAAFDGRADAGLRTIPAKDPMQAYPLTRLNQTLLIELGTVYGQEATDSQNPYVWQSRGVLAYDVDSQNSKLVPTYGDAATQTADDVALNVRATAGILEA